MPTTVTRLIDVTYFRWSELSDAAKNHVRAENVRAHDMDTDDIQNIIGDTMVEHGLAWGDNTDELDFHYTLAYCQGDGVSFEGTIRAEDMIDFEAWVDCWAGFPERTFSTDLDPERLHFVVTVDNQHRLWMDVEARYFCLSDELHDECGNEYGSEIECGDEQCPTDDELTAIAARALEHLHKIADVAYRRISDHCLDDRDDDFAELFEDTWFDSAGRECDGPDTNL